MTAELPMFALTLHLAAMPMPIGSSRPVKMHPVRRNHHSPGSDFVRERAPAPGFRAERRNSISGEMIARAGLLELRNRLRHSARLTSVFRLGLVRYRGRAID